MERNIAMKIKPAFTPVNIAFAANDGYAVPLSVTLYSMMKNASKARFYDILVMHKDISPENREMLLKVAAHFPNCSLRFIDFGSKDSLVSGNMKARSPSTPPTARRRSSVSATCRRARPLTAATR